MHGAMDGDCRHAGLVHAGDLADVGEVGGVGKTFVVHDHIKTLGPFRIVIERDLGFGAVAALVDDGPFRGGQFGDGVGELLRLERIIMATAAGDQQDTQGLGFRRRLGWQGAEVQECNQENDTWQHDLTLSGWKGWVNSGTNPHFGEAKQGGCKWEQTWTKAALRSDW